MSCACSPRTRPSPAKAEASRRGRQGAVSLVVIFLLVIFSGLGLSMVFLSEIYMKMNGHRKFSRLADYSSENGLKRGLQDLEDWIQSAGPFSPISETRLGNFRGDPEAGFAPLLEEGLRGGFPRRLSESAGSMSWESLATCGIRSLEDRGDFFRITAALRIESSGAWGRLPWKKDSSLEGALGILAGHLPLPSIPLLIDKEMSEAEKSGFLASNGISFLTEENRSLQPTAPVTGEGLIPKEADGLVAKALKVGVFSPQDLSPARLREVLGLEASNDPVPDGVYLIRDDLGLGGIFVQGDIDEMVMAVNGDAQVIVFRQAGGEWRLEFSPSRSRTEFSTPEGSSVYDLVPLGIIILDGTIGSLGGGVVDGAGSVVMVTDREVPAILSGVGLTIVSSGRITLSSHLILQGARWQDGIPYVKDSVSQLIIFSTGQDMVTGEQRDGGIAVAEEAPDGLKVHASLSSGGGDFEIVGTGKTVEILGALHAAGFLGNGNSLRIAPDERFAAGELCENAPLATEPRFSIYSLKVLSWREY
jgi:hypothetical protein